LFWSGWFAPFFSVQLEEDTQFIKQAEALKQNKLLKLGKGPEQLGRWIYIIGLGLRSRDNWSARTNITIKIYDHIEKWSQ
jgi:hypothetical protein